MGSPKEPQMIGCLGRHGSYSFFKSIKFGSRTLSVSSFFPVRIWPDSAILSIAEAQLLWSDRNESFCSLRLYFLPENTPEGRQQQHGEDEVIALQDKVIIRASDLYSWLVEDSEWDWGYMTPESACPQGTNSALCKAFISEKFRKTDKTYDLIDTGLGGVVVLNYERYIRLRTILKRLEGSSELSNWLSHPLIMALGGLNVGPKCRLLFAKEVFDYPELEDHELLCNHLAPKLKVKPKKKRRRRNNSMGSESNESETSSAGSSVSEKCKKPLNGLQQKFNMDNKSNSGLKNAASLNSDVVIGANSNGLQILKIQPSESKSVHLGSSRSSKSQGQAALHKTERKSGLNNILKMCNDPKGGERHINAELLGPALSELAQKLEKSNALQILPIRPSVIHKQDSNFELDGPRTKKIKTEHSRSSGCGNERSGYQKHSSSSLSGVGIMGPPGKNSMKPGLFMGHLRGRQPDIPPHLDAKSTGAARVNRPFNKAERGILSITPVDTDLKNHGPILPMCMRSPSPFMSTSRIYGDPSVSRKTVCKPNLPSPSSDVGLDTEILDFSVKKSRKGGDSTRPALNVNVNVNVNLESELLDLSVKSQSHSSKHIFHNLANIPPPNAMNQLGLRLTSEVTLFPSTNAQFKSKDSFLPPAHSHNGPGCSSSSKSNSNPNDWRSSPSASASAYVPTTGKDNMTNAHTHHKPPVSTMERLPLPGHSHGTAAKPVATMINDKEKEGRERDWTRNSDKFNKSLSQFMQPSNFPKMDQNYLSLFGAPLFMPPQGLMSIPGAMEQFQIYKDLLQKGIVPQFPSWPHSTGKERGPKS